MKKAILSLLFISGLAYSANSQSRSVEGVAEFQGKKVPAAVIEFPYSQDKVEDAIAEKMATKGHKPTKAKDYKLYRSVSVGSEKKPYDVYVKTERKSRREKESSVVYIVLVQPNEPGSHEATGSAAAVIAGKEFLNDYSEHVVEYNFQLEIIEQENVVKKLEKKQTSLRSDSTDLVAKSKLLDEKILENSNDLLKQRGEIEKQRLTLEAIKARKKN